MPKALLWRSRAAPPIWVGDARLAAGAAAILLTSTLPHGLTAYPVAATVLEGTESAAACVGAQGVRQEAATAPPRIQLRFVLCRTYFSSVRHRPTANSPFGVPGLRPRPCTQHISQRAARRSA